PDPDSTTEMARVYGECTYAINTSMLGLSVIDSSDQRHQMIQQIVDELIKTRYSNFPWKVHTQVFDHPVPNAFTTGGGFLAAFSGVYAMTDDEAALAGVIAHELSHMATIDTMEIAQYLERMLALRIQQGGLDEEYEVGTALKTVVDFCLAIPGLVNPKWKNDLIVEGNVEINVEINEVYGDKAVPHIPYTYSQDPESAYYALLRDSDGQALNSSCNGGDDGTDQNENDEFIEINPDYYLTTYPDAASLPPIPEGLGGGLGGLPTAEALWKADPWLQFQQTAFMRYAECQADEGSMLNLFASGYNPLALNQSFSRMLTMFDMDEKSSDWRFINHPSLGQRIEDNRAFIANNSDELPTIAEIEQPGSPFHSYVALAEQVASFEGARDAAREALFGAADVATAGAKDIAVKNVDVTDGKSLEDFTPITVADLAMVLLEEFSKQKQIAGKSTSGQSKDDAQCDVFSAVYKKLTGNDSVACLPVN
ncbi:MAG: M48 family metalloprotease, partial [Pseudomonadales bacterium]|nr:M48 family metalloprotease [Pseudomonadales bacterium]